MKSFDQPPSAEELMALYVQAEQNDPRSRFYKRVLVRPKLSVKKILLFLLATVAFCVLVSCGVYYMSGSSLFAMLACLSALLLICLLFAKKILIGTVKIYQTVAPAGVRNRCRYEPSCSVYMILAVEKYGLIHGVRRGLARWKSCKPPNGGYDLP